MHPTITYRSYYYLSQLYLWNFGRKKCVLRIQAKYLPANFLKQLRSRYFLDEGNKIITYLFSPVTVRCITFGHQTRTSQELHWIYAMIKILNSQIQWRFIHFILLTLYIWLCNMAFHYRRLVSVCFVEAFGSCNYLFSSLWTFLLSQVLPR